MKKILFATAIALAMFACSDDSSSSPSINSDGTLDGVKKLSLTIPVNTGSCDIKSAKWSKGESSSVTQKVDYKLSGDTLFIFEDSTEEYASIAFGKGNDMLNGVWSLSTCEYSKEDGIDCGNGEKEMLKLKIDNKGNVEYDLTEGIEKAKTLMWESVKAMAMGIIAPLMKDVTIKDSSDNKLSLEYKSELLPVSVPISFELSDVKLTPKMNDGELSYDEAYAVTVSTIDAKGSPVSCKMEVAKGQMQEEYCAEKYTADTTSFKYDKEDNTFNYSTMEKFMGCLAQTPIDPVLDGLQK